MKLLHCATCDAYTDRANFNFETNHPGRIRERDGVLVIEVGGRSLPPIIPFSKAEAQYCMEDGTELTVQDVDPCPHTTDDQYWRVHLEPKKPVRVCRLCGVRIEGTYEAVWPS